MLHDQSEATFVPSLQLRKYQQAPVHQRGTIEEHLPPQCLVFQQPVQVQTGSYS